VWTASRKVGNLTLDAGLRSVTWVVYLTVFLLVLRRALRTRTRAHQDIALFFGATVMLIGLISVETLPGTALPRWLAVGIGAVALTLPYLLLRLVAGFAQISPWVPCLRVRHLSDLPHPGPALWSLRPPCPGVRGVQWGRRTGGPCSLNIQAVIPTALDPDVDDIDLDDWRPPIPPLVTPAPRRP
jgi:hypothetical protein